MQAQLQQDELKRQAQATTAIPQPLGHPSAQRQVVDAAEILNAATRPMSEKMKAAEAKETREREVESLDAAIHEKLTQSFQRIEISWLGRKTAKPPSVEQQALISAVTAHITAQIAKNETISTDQIQGQNIVDNISTPTKTLVEEMLKRPEYTNKTFTQIQEQFQKDSQSQKAIALAAKEAAEKSTPKSKEPSKQTQPSHSR